MQVFNITSAKVFAASTALSLVLGGAAMAADAKAVAERIKDIYGKQGVEVSYANVKEDGSSIVLEGTKAKLATVSDDEFTVGDVQLNNVEDGENGAFKIGEIVVPDMEIDAKEGKDEKVLVKNVRMENVTLPSTDAKTALDKMLFYEKSSVGELQFGMPGSNGAVLKDVVATMTAADRAKKIDFTMNIGSVDAVFEKGGKNPLEPLGMNELHASVKSNGTWEPTDGNAKLDNFIIDAADIGKVNIVADIGGYDLAFVEALQQTQQNMTKADADQQAAGLAMLGLAEQLTIKSMEIRFDDASVTNKLLDYYGKQQGSDGKALGEQMKMMVPLMATQLKNPDFAQQLKAAADKYFTDPKSLTVSASPDQPVTLASIVATASLDPTKIIQLLKVSVEANN